MLVFLVMVGVLGVLFESVFIAYSIYEELPKTQTRSFALQQIIFIGILSVGLLGYEGINCLSYEEVSETGNWELMAITDDVRTSGKGSGGGLFYVCSSIDTDEIYSFYYKVDDDNFKRKTVKTDSAVIHEEDNCTPHVVEYTTYTKSKMNRILRWILTFDYGELEQKHYDIYTHKGTIL